MPGFLSSLGGFFSGPVFGGIADLFGGLAGLEERRGLIKGIENRAQFQPQSVNVGPFAGSLSGKRTDIGFNPQGAALQGLLGGFGTESLLGQTPFATGGLNQFLGDLNIGNQFGAAEQALSQQASPTAFGTLSGLAGQAGALGNIFANQAAAGPVDFTGGALGATLGGGLSNIAGAGNTDQLRQNFLGTQRAAATGGLLDQAINRLQNRQFATGRLGSTGGAQETESFLNALAQQDLGFQNNAFGLAQQEAARLGQLGLGQLGQAQGFLGQNLGQFNQSANLANQFLGLGAGLEGQQFGQNLQALGQNQSAGLQRLAAAQGLIGLGGDIFGGAQTRGLQGLGLLSDREKLLANFALGLRNAEADRIQAAGASTSGLANIAGQGGSGIGGFLGGIGSVLGGIF